MADQLNNENGTSDVPAPHVMPTIDGSRRRFTGAGLAATGVIMTLASRPVLGCSSTVAAHSPSGWSSMNASQCTGTAASVVLGDTPKDWLAAIVSNSIKIGGDKVKDSTKCQELLGGETLLRKMTVSEALTSSKPFEMEIMCGYLNAASGKTVPYLTTAQVLQMAKGSFTPSTGGTAWGVDKITAYLRQTHR